MTRSSFAALALTVSFASSAAAQSLGSTWTRTFFGCDKMRSCHRVVFNMSPDPSWPYTNQIGSVMWQSWFFVPGVVVIMGTSPFNPYGYEFGGINTVYSWYDEGSDGYAAAGLDWRPNLVGVRLSYGALGGIFPDEELWSSAQLSLESSSTVIPEPASLLLLATGVFGVATNAARRRRRR